ncbi:hypothetical protein [Pseudarthrobacter sulfonivorans]|uniref:hypothetical protein n=1 Tax=Pseudarthrobacter sulfonivorans TaxID=121292 RepID=UPI0021054A2E|nr:hypothetical protein [Pseudarthrobacter sulfonivorans]
MTGMVQQPGSLPGPTVPGDITRLNPVDGLFLRGEHLAVIQTYARQLAEAVGTVGGTGVVYGYSMVLDGKTLRVGPGLAIDPSGCPLRSTAEAVLELKETAILDPNGFLRVEVGPAEWPAGHEKTYGDPCGSTCSGSGEGIQPWMETGVTVHVEPDSLPGLAQSFSRDRRGRLASAYFERERHQGKPWLATTPNGQPLNPLTRWPWAAGTERAPAGRVPLAALQRFNNNWVLDVWTARRDVGGPPAAAAWQSRLQMRPWNIFMAQVLQFQAQLSANAAVLDKIDFDTDTFKKYKVLRDFRSRVKIDEATRQELGEDFLRQVDAAARSAPFARAKSGVSLVSLGFQELPPAGYLPVPRGAPTVESAVSMFFGTHIDYRVISCDPDYIPQAVEEAQHRERIPLAQPAPYPRVDVLVPRYQSGKEAPSPWVAFVRRSEGNVQPTPTDPIDVFIDIVDHQGTTTKYTEGTAVDPKKKIVTMEYPANGWAYPGQEVSLKVLKELSEQVPEPRNMVMTVVGLASTAERRPLLSLRASLLAASLDTGLPAPPIYTFRGADKQREAIVIVFEHQG